MILWSEELVYSIMYFKLKKIEKYHKVIWALQYIQTFKKVQDKGINVKAKCKRTNIKRFI